MKFLLVGDLHEQETSPRSRTDDFQTSKNEKIQEILKIKNEKKINHILQTGDFFDTFKYDNNFLMKQFLLWCSTNEIKDNSLTKENLSLIQAYQNYPSMIGVLGNHEMPGGNFNKDAHKQTPYHLFEKIGIPLMKFVSKENPIIFTTEDGLKIAITGTRYHLDIDKPGNEVDYIVEEKLGDIHIHIVHGYLTDKYKGKMFHHTLVKDIAKQTKADITLTGHDHIGFDLIEVDGKYFLNPGAVLRLSNDKKEMKRTVKVVSCEITKEKGIVFENIPLKSAKNAEDVLDRKKIEKSKEKKKRLEDFKQQVRAGTNSSHLDIIAFLNSFLENEESKFPEAVVKNAIARVTEKRIKNSVTKQEVLPYKISKVILNNFESHKNTVVELDDNLNILVGESGHGKSSVFRGIRWVVKNNPAGRDMVRIGESKTNVTLVLSNGYEITRYVTKSKNGYIITDPDGTTTEYNTKALSEIQSILGFTQLRVDKDMVYDFNFSNQGDGWFLIGNQFTAPGRSKIIGSIYGTHHADAANREINSEILSIRDENKRLYDRKDKIEKELVQYEYLDDLGKQIAFLEKKIAEINQMKKEKEDLLNILKRYEYKKGQLLEVEDTLKQLPDITKLQLMYFQLKEQYQVKEQLLKNTEAVESIQTKKKNAEIAIKQTEQLDKYRNLISRMKIAEEKKQKLIQLHGEFSEKKKLFDNQLVVIEGTNTLSIAKDKYVSLQELFVLQEKIQLLIPQYEKTIKGLNNIKLSIDSTKNIGIAQTNMDVLKNHIEQKDKLLQFIQKYKEVQTHIQKELSIIKEQTVIMEEAIDAYNEELLVSKACPTCFAPITEETTQRILTKFKGGN